MNIKEQVFEALEELKAALLSTNLCSASVMYATSEKWERPIIRMEITGRSNLLMEATMCVFDQISHEGELHELYKFALIERILPDTESLSAKVPRDDIHYCIEVELDNFEDGDSLEDNPRAGVFLDVIGRFSYFVEKFAVPLSAQLRASDPSKTGPEADVT